jgi:hypothetical protein
MQDILYELFSFNNTFCHVELLNSTCFGHARQIIKKEERDCPHKTRTPAHIEVTNERWTVQNKRPEQAQTERKKKLGRDCWRNTLNRDEYILDVCST